MSSGYSAQQAALRAAFGSSSEEDEEEQQGVAAAHPLVPGLHLRRGFLSPAAQASLLAAVRAHGWAPPEERAVRNQAMHFGHATLPPFARRLCADVAAAARGMLPPELLQLPFNQLICNSYAPGAFPCGCLEARGCEAEQRPTQARASARTWTWRLSRTALPASLWARPW